MSCALSLGIWGGCSSLVLCSWETESRRFQRRFSEDSLGWVEKTFSSTRFMSRGLFGVIPALSFLGRYFRFTLCHLCCVFIIFTWVCYFLLSFSLLRWICMRREGYCLGTFLLSSSWSLVRRGWIFSHCFYFRMSLIVWWSYLFSLVLHLSISFLILSFIATGSHLSFWVLPSSQIWFFHCKGVVIWFILSCWVPVSFILLTFLFSFALICVVPDFLLVSLIRFCHLETRFRGWAGVSRPTASMSG